MDERLVVCDRNGWERRVSADFLSLGRKPRQEVKKSRKSEDIEDQDLISGFPLAAMRYMARIGVSFMYGGWPWKLLTKFLAVQFWKNTHVLHFYRHYSHWPDVHFLSILFAFNHLRGHPVGSAFEWHIFQSPHFKNMVHIPAKVFRFLSPPTLAAKPKSVILTRPSIPRRMLSDLRSLWMISCLWRNWMPCRTSLVIEQICVSDKIV